MIRVGIVGIGFMGMIHYLACKKVKAAEVMAIASRSKRKREGDWRGIRGNFGPEGQIVDLGGISRYESLGQLLSDDAIDLVDICLPPSLHADAAEMALRAGKHVLCEKPIAVSQADADRMVRTAEQTGKLLMIGQVLPFFPEYAYLRGLVEAGTHGRLLGGFFKRIISDPTWIADYYDPVTSGGPLIDLHVHDAHFIRLLCGLPERVLSSGRLRGEVVEFATTQFLFGGASAPDVTAMSGVINQQGRPFAQGFEVHLEGATVLYDFANMGGKPALAMPLTVLTEDGAVLRPDIPAADPSEAFVAELQEVAAAIERGSASWILAGTTARDALRLCHVQAKSVRSRTTVRV